MDRRAAISLMVKSLGLTIALPTVLSTLAACQHSTAVSINKTTQPLLFLSESRYLMVKGVVDVILPKTDDIVGANDLNIALFIDMLLAQTMNADLQRAFNLGATLFDAQLDTLLTNTKSQPTIVSYQQLVSEYFDITSEQQESVFALQSTALADVASEQLNNYYLYTFLLTTRQLCLLGFYTSEYIGEQVLNYDPIPGEYHPCIDVIDVGNAWSS